MWRPCKQFNWVLIAGLALCSGDRARAQDDVQGEPPKDEPRQPSSRKDLDEKDIVGYIETHIPVYGVQLRTVAAAPEGFYGEVLSVPGEVGEVLSQHAFALRDPVEP